MPYLNEVKLIGHLGKDPEVTQMESGKTVLNFSVATNRNYKDRNGEWQSVTNWHNCSYWAEFNEYLQRNLHKGACVYVAGRIENRQVGDKFYTNIAARDVKIFGAQKAESAFAEIEEDEINGNINDDIPPF